MGRILQIRVSAYTFNPQEVEKAWPTLFEIAFGQDQKVNHPGVFELITRLKEKILFEEIQKEIEEVLEPKLKEISLLQKKVEEALANWEPKEANQLSYQLEDKLDNLEQEIKKII